MTGLPSVDRVTLSHDTSTRTGGLRLVLASQVCVQFGAAVAAGLFPRAGALGVVSLRLGLAALVLLAVCRPALRGHGRAGWTVIVGFGAALATMNSLFYEAIARIPLGAAVTFEVLGPLALTVVTSRRPLSWVWAGLALAGVVLLGRDGLHDLDPLGVACALGAGATWACYIVLSQRTGDRFGGLDGLALAMAVGAALALPPGVFTAGATLVEPAVLGIGAAVALLSSLLPYSLELLALRRMRAATFAILMSLAPAIAATAGVVVLGQSLGVLTVVAIGLVVAASAGAVASAQRPAGSPSWLYAYLGRAVGLASHFARERTT